LLFPLLLFLIIKQVLFGWVVGLLMGGQVALGCDDGLRHAARLPGHNGIVMPDVPGAILGLLFLLLLLLFFCECLHPALLERLDILGNSQTLVLRDDEAALRLRRAGKRVNKVLAFNLVIEGRVGINFGICKLARANTL